VELVLSLLWLAVAIWLILRAFRQRHGLEHVKLNMVDQSGELPLVSVIVPARNEGSNIGPCMHSLLNQRYSPDRLRLVVVDDDSTDDTAEIVASLAAKDRRIKLVSAPPLPPGWNGKVHACTVGAAAAPSDSRWLCFIDADMRAQPLLMPSAIAAAERRSLDLLSLSPRHELRTLPERLLIPCGLYVLAFSQNLTSIQAPESAKVVATGQFMLLRRAIYDAVGGYATVRSAICEDIELARLLKRQGYSVLLLDGSKLLSTRMYTGWRTLWLGFAKNLSDMLGGPARAVVIAIVAIVLAWASILLPLFDTSGCFNGSETACLATAPALLASAAAFAFHIAGAWHFGIPFWYGFLFPFGYTIGAMIALDSLRRRLTHRIYWKGRIYP